MFVGTALLVLGWSVSYATAASVAGVRAHHRRGLIEPSSVQFSPKTLGLVIQRLAENANHSWEIGTRETALLELDSPSLFLYGPKASIPPPSLKTAGSINTTQVFTSVDQVVANKPPGIPTFFSDDATGDPASVGIPVLIRNWTIPFGTPLSNYSLSATSELNYLVNSVNRSASGAISQRGAPEPVQLWADFMAMAPPFIAYYGALHSNRTLLSLAYSQIAAYREELLDTDSGLFKHIVFGGPGSPPTDFGHWSTGNAWAVQGMIRVLRAIELSDFSIAMLGERTNLTTWALELSSAAWEWQQSEGYLWNYLDIDPASNNTAAGTSFPDASGTALMAANTFRLAALTFDPISNSSYFDPAAASSLEGVAALSTSSGVAASALTPNVAAAEKARQYVVNSVNATDGWLSPVVNPEDWYSAGSNSPEGQAFVLLLQAAYRDWWNLTHGHY